jgi:hypothetical protein
VTPKPDIQRTQGDAALLGTATLAREVVVLFETAIAMDVGKSEQWIGWLIAMSPPVFIKDQSWRYEIV